MPRKPTTSSTSTTLPQILDENGQPKEMVRVLRSKTGIGKRKADTNVSRVPKRAALGDVTNRNQPSSSEQQKPKKTQPIKSSTKASKISKHTTTRVTGRTKLPSDTSLSSVNSRSTLSVTSVSSCTSVENVAKPLVKLTRAPLTPIPHQKIIPQHKQPEQSKQTDNQTTQPAHTQKSRPLITEIDPADDYDLVNPDPNNTPEFTKDIFAYYCHLEDEKSVNVRYMEEIQGVTLEGKLPSSSDGVSIKMRSILVDWMIEVQENFQLNHETLYLAVRLIDFYLSKVKVHKKRLQLIGAVALFIAAKYDERIPPGIEDFLYICDGAYSRAQFVTSERDVFRENDFFLGLPISYRFLRRYAKATNRTMYVLTLARFINETALMAYNLLKYKESLLAAGCLRLAMLMVNPQDKYDRKFEYFCGYKECDLYDVLSDLNSTMLFYKDSSLLTARDKYSHEIFMKVADVPLLTQNTIDNHFNNLTDWAYFSISSPSNDPQ